MPMIDGYPRMIENRCLFLTGGTGLVGGYLLDRLCRIPQLEIHVLVRPKGGDSPRKRLSALGAFFGDAERFGSVRVHEGDIALPNLGLDETTVRRLRDRVTDIVHSAASVTFSDSQQNYQTNEQGMQRILQAFPAADRFFHMSTAYVGGLTASFRETDLDVGQSFRNDYERSKFEVERVVRAHFSDVPGTLTVLRPSIVTGEEGTGKTFQFLTLSKVLRMMSAFAKRHPGETFSLTYAPDATQNYIPVNRMADMVEEIILRPDCWGKTYHLVNEHPPTNRQFRALLEEHFGFRIRNREPDESDRPLNRVSVESTRPYLVYLKGEPVFDCEQRNVLQTAQRPIVFDKAYLGKLLEYCEKTRWGKRLDIYR